jgi:hypothetical protein
MVDVKMIKYDTKLRELFRMFRQLLDRTVSKFLGNEFGEYLRGAG